jgi:D-alanyl-lipoteichoic acid acyltransferase DltB (MBOAT superfamily)
MLFNSIEFALFLPVVFATYWFVVNKDLRKQNMFLLIASWVFYGWWDWRFMLLLIFLSILNFITGIGIGSSDSGKKRKAWLIAGLVLNLGVLGVFKYFNFFIESFIDLVSLFGYDLPSSSLKIILPMGISFYVFLSLSYLLDINKKTIEANRNITEVLLSLSFFPIILAGPIQRPSLLLPQIKSNRVFESDKIVNGLRQILWGLFTKVVIADNLALYSDEIFLNYSAYPGSALLMGAVFYAIQIYADFSGYSNIAIGTAGLFGFSLMKNFGYPYFSRDITEFWKRWHISLTTWFRDYIFLPLSFKISSRINSGKVLFMKTDLFIYTAASIVTWFLTGLWHGANYTFIIWGLIHGFFLIVHRWQLKPRRKFLKRISVSNDNKLIVTVETLMTLALVLITWIFFRADNLDHGLQYLSGIFSVSLFSIPEFPFSRMILLVVTFLVIIFLLAEWAGRNELFPLSGIGTKMPWAARWSLYYTLVAVIFFFAGSSQQFIYFQF